MNPEDELVEEQGESLPELEAPHFAVHTVLNAERQLEASKAVSPKLPKILSFLCMGIAAAMIGVLLWLYFTGKGERNLFLAIVIVPILGYMVYSRLLMPKKAMQRWEEKLYDTYGTGELHLCTEFYDKALAQTLQETDDLTTEGYSDLRELRETEHLFLLRHSAQQWYFIEKDGFTVGTAEEFRTFITERIGG